MPEVVFDDDGVFGQNIVRKPSKQLDFDTVLGYMKAIFNLSRNTTKLYDNISKVMPFFRLPPQAIGDLQVPNECFKHNQRELINVEVDSLQIFRKLIPELAKKYKDLMSEQRSERNISL
jgi:hypothetical protein